MITTGETREVYRKGCGCPNRMWFTEAMKIFTNG